MPLSHMRGAWVARQLRPQLRKEKPTDDTAALMSNDLRALALILALSKRLLEFDG
jgi:hypothetical protein